MAMLPMCRVCLVNDLTLYSIKKGYCNVYEKIINSKLNKVDYPVSMCYICLSVLQKCQMFMETAEYANNVLEQWYNYNQQNESKNLTPRPFHCLSATTTTSTEISSIYESVNEINQEIKKEEIASDEEEKEIFIKFDKLDNADTVYNFEYNLETVTGMESNLNVEEDPSLPNHSNTFTETKPLDYKEWTEDTQQLPAGKYLVVESCTVPNKVVKVISKEKCTRANKKMKNAELEDNPVTQNTAESSYKERFSCKICGAAFKCNRNLKRHEYNVHSGQKPLACDMCDYKTADKCALLRHKIKHSVEKPYSCNLCDFKTAHKPNLKLHSKLHTNEKKFPCHICNQKFIQKGGLKHHLLKHFNEKPFLCDLCGYKSAYKEHLLSHVRRIHNREKPFHCDLCNQKFAAKTNLRRHLMVHNNVKPFSCSTCSYKCTSNIELKRHSVCHSDDRPYSCKYCQSKFKKKSTLVIHVRIHTGEKPYACHLCDFTCNQNSSLNSHIRRHSRKKTSL